MNNDVINLIDNISFVTNIDFGSVRATKINKDGIDINLICLADCLKILGLKNKNQTAKMYCTSNYYIQTPIVIRNRYGVSTNKNNTKVIRYITEAELYDLITKSRKPNAVKFRQWIYESVIPTLVKHRVVPNHNEYKAFDNIEDIADLKEMSADQAERIDRLEEEVNYYKYKLSHSSDDATLGKYVRATSGSKSIGEVAQIIRKMGYSEFGRNTLYKWLKNNKYLVKEHGEYRVAQSKINSGYMELKYGKYGDATVRVLPKGMERIIKRLIVDNEIENYIANKKFNNDRDENGFIVLRPRDNVFDD